MNKIYGGNEKVSPLVTQLSDKEMLRKKLQELASMPEIEGNIEAEE